MFRLLCDTSEIGNFDWKKLLYIFRHILGEALSSLNFKELKNLETRLEKGISRIRSKKVLLYVSFVTMFSTVNSFHQFNALFLCSNLLLFCQNELLFAEIEYMQKRVNNASYFICLFGFFFFFLLLVLRVIFAFQHTQLQLSSN